MKIKKILIAQIILSTTTALIPNAQAMVDDFDSHCTRVAGRTIPHIATPGPEISSGTVIFFDDRLPPHRKLSLRPRGKLISYTCPAEAGVTGLERPRPMGLAPEYLTQESDPTRPTATGIELVRASTNISGVPVLAGLYHPTGTVNLSSKIEKDQRIDTKRLTCRTGQDDGLRFDIEYKEFIYHIPYSFAFSKGRLTRENPKAPTTSPWFTFSCWVLPVRNQQEIFSWTYPAPEPEFEGQKKRLAFGIDPVTNKAVHRAFVKSPLVETSTKDKIIPEEKKIITVEEKRQVKGTITMPKHGIALPSNKKAINAVETKKLGVTATQLSILSSITQGKAVGGNAPFVFDAIEVKPWMFSCKPGGKLRNCGNNFTITKTVTYKVPKTVVTPAKTVKETIKTLKEDLKFSPEFATSSTNWMHLALFVDASKKSMKVHVNGKDIFTLSNPNIISLNEPCSLQIGDPRYPTQGLLADINLANGQNLSPSAFCSITSQGVLMPKNFTGTFGTNGFQLRGNHALNLGTRDVLDTSPNKTQWKAQWEANGSVSFSPKSPTTL